MGADDVSSSGERKYTMNFRSWEDFWEGRRGALKDKQKDSQKTKEQLGFLPGLS